MNSYIKSNLATKEAAVSISDDLEVNMKAVFGEEISDVVDASFSADAPAVIAVTPVTLAATVSSVVAVAEIKDDSEDIMSTCLGDKKTDEEEETASDVAEGNIQKKEVSVLGCFCISSYMI
jgi:hypothetical protein